MLYPYNSPIILTDNLYSAYGGHLNLSTSQQRQAAYFISEKFVSNDLSTYLTPTIVTGTFSLADMRDNTLFLEHTYISRVILTRFINEKESIYWSATGTANSYVSLRNKDYGKVNIHYLIGSCNCSYHGELPYKIEVIYECGFSSGTVYQPDMLLALATLADIELNEIIGYGNEAPGDVGVQSYNNQEYSERRVSLLRTSFGTSARAAFVQKLLTGYKRRTRVGMI